MRPSPFGKRFDGDLGLVGGFVSSDAGLATMRSDLSSNMDAASKLMTEMGTITGNGTVTEATCTKLDDLMVRAKKL